MKTGAPIPTPAFIPPASADDLLVVRGDRRFMGLVSRCQIDVGYYVLELERLREHIRTTLSQSLEGRDSIFIHSGWVTLILLVVTPVRRGPLPLTLSG